MQPVWDHGTGTRASAELSLSASPAGIGSPTLAAADADSPVLPLQ